MYLYLSNLLRSFPTVDESVGGGAVVHIEAKKRRRRATAAIYIHHFVSNEYIYIFYK
jgi:hypothetical protein